MHWTIFPAYFLGGAFLANAVPHIVNGISGRPFQTPFASPPGKGMSSPTVNVFWGFFNLLVAYFLIVRTGSFDLRNNLHVALAGTGMLAISILSARVFAPSHGGQ